MSAPNVPPSCANCRFYRHRLFEPVCVRTAKTVPHVVTGVELEAGVRYCGQERARWIDQIIPFGRCGYRGRFFEPRDMAAEAAEVNERG